MKPLVALLVLCATATGTEARTWTSQNGEFKATASLVTFNDKHVVLMRNKKLISVPLEKLSRDDLLFLLKTPSARMEFPQLPEAKPDKVAGDPSLAGNAPVFPRNAPKLNYKQLEKKLRDVEVGWTRKQVWAHLGRPDSIDADEVTPCDYYHLPGHRVFYFYYAFGAAAVIDNTTWKKSTEAAMDFFDPNKFQPPSR